MTNPRGFTTNTSRNELGDPYQIQLPGQQVRRANPGAADRPRPRRHLIIDIAGRQLWLGASGPFVRIQPELDATLAIANAIA